MLLVVTPLRRLAETVAKHSPSHLVSLLSPDEMIATPAGFSSARHLRLGVHDVHEPTARLVAPEPADIERLIAFAEAWDLTAPMAIHCFAGVSRSTASAFVVACALSPRADELSIALSMRRASPEAFPNRRIVALADDILDRRGRMAEAVEAMGGNGFISEGVPFALAARQ